MAMHRYISIVLKLSLVCGIAYGIYDAYATYSKWRDIGIAYERQRQAMACAAKLPDSWFLENTNEMGYANVSSECGYGDGTTYMVKMEWIQRERNGEDTSEELKLLQGQPYDIIGMILSFGIGFLSVLAVGIMLMGTYRIARWIVR
jgi:hypothetical protein